MSLTIGQQMSSINEEFSYKIHNMFYTESER